MDETFVGGVEPGVKGRQTKDKAVVIVAAEVRGMGTGRIRMARIANGSGEQIIVFLREAVAPGSTLRTDGWKGYQRLTRDGYSNVAISIKGSGKKAHELFPRVHRVAALVKRLLLSTHQGAVRPEQLRYYLEMSTPFGTIGVRPSTGGCCSSGCSSRRWEPTPLPTSA